MSSGNLEEKNQSSLACAAIGLMDAALMSPACDPPPHTDRAYVTVADNKGMTKKTHTHKKSNCMNC